MKRIVCLVCGHRWKIVRRRGLTGGTYYVGSHCERCGRKGGVG